MTLHRTNCTPCKLYKYRKFDNYALRWLCDAEVYYAAPSTFNDPLDCNPVFENDLDRESLERLRACLLVEKHGKDGTQGVQRNYMVHHKAEHYNVGQLKADVERLFRATMARRGVLSLSNKWACPLMWSHYADEHRGICIEFDLTKHLCKRLRPVDYGLPRRIPLSDVLEWKMCASESARERVLDAYFISKAAEWRYEREWRELSVANGPGAAPFRVSGVYFGLRCERAVQAAIVKLLADASELPLAFYSMIRREESWKLDRTQWNAENVALMKGTALRPTPLVFEDETPLAKQAL